ncbi:DMT family transporter [Endozoicomonas sp. SM1973]|uniref:DMT family transporter n=1 Tax=Spartinivicinus marinus TaxID=2994442 RepID=A0A853I808_9GAMM|nr:DMT family transporter [Spartinivicinus marinus]MCX4025704.1 DMT family transporter [Spartinivicinus marinus]NYZ65697.1 DMT family transporter [Spartinivicinus marinus]
MRFAHSGIYCAIFGYFLFSLMDAIGKWLTQTYSIVEITFFSSLFSLLPVSFMLTKVPLKKLLTTQRPSLHLLRGIIILGLRLTALFAFSLMPLADGFALILTGPIILCIISPFLLGDKNTIYQYLAIGIGFIGVLIVLRPGFTIFNLGILGALGAATCFALNTVLMKKMSATENKGAMLFYGMSFTILISGLMIIPSFSMPGLLDLSLFAACGLAAGFAQIFIFNALKTVPASTVGAFQYSCIVWGMIIGYLIWQTKPDIFIILGSLFIIASGIAISKTTKTMQPQRAN